MYSKKLIEMLTMNILKLFISFKLIMEVFIIKISKIKSCFYYTDAAFILHFNNHEM